MTKPVLANYIGGRWQASTSSALLDVVNPADGTSIGKVPVSSPDEVDAAVAAAQSAFLAWRQAPAPERVQPLFRLKELLEQEKDELAVTITKENGKTLEEARGEVRRAIDNVEVACGIPSLMQGRTLAQVSRGIDELMERVPLGVCAVIPPFNFPAMVPSWFWPYAVACGNAAIVKPSELVPITMQRLFGLIEQAGFPPGVLNLVNGDGTVAELLIRHPGVAAVSSVTSTPTAKAIYALAAQCGKRVQCGGGAKNFMVVMPDADLEQAVPSIIDSVYGNAGQRCLAGANVLALGEVAEHLVPALVEAASRLVVGNGLDQGVTMGPLISSAARQRVVSYIERGVREGGELLLDGRLARVPKEGYFLGPTVFDRVGPETAIAGDEVFGPLMSILRASSFEEAVDLINNSPYGNSAVVYTRNGRAAREFAREVDCGQIGVNVGLAAPMAFFPFAGRKESFFGTLHGQGQDAVEFFTDKKIVIARWWA